MIRNIPITLRGNNEILRVEYTENTSVVQSGLDALELPFPAERCLGYPTIYAYSPDMKLTGYKRYCGFIQLIQRIEKKGQNEHIYLNIIYRMILEAWEIRIFLMGTRPHCLMLLAIIWGIVMS